MDMNSENNIIANEAVAERYKVFIAVKEEASDIRAAIPHYCPKGKIIHTLEDGNNSIYIVRED